MQSPKTLLMCGLATITIAFALLKMNVPAALSLAVLAGVAIAPQNVEMRVSKVLQATLDAVNDTKSDATSNPKSNATSDSEPPLSTTTPEKTSSRFNRAVYGTGIEAVRRADEAGYARNVSARNTLNMPEPIKARQAFVEGMNKIVFGRDAGQSYSI